jgi:hypothetical protein
MFADHTRPKRRSQVQRRSCCAEQLPLRARRRIVSALRAWARLRLDNAFAGQCRLRWGGGSVVANGAMLQTDARSGELPLIGSLGCWRNTRFKLALPGPNGG